MLYRRIRYHDPGYNYYLHAHYGTRAGRRYLQVKFRNIVRLITEWMMGLSIPERVAALRAKVEHSVPSLRFTVPVRLFQPNGASARFRTELCYLCHGANAF